MSEMKLEGRLGVETINPIRGCCVDSILSWRPQAIGEKHKCIYCDNYMKTIRAGDAADQEWSGMLNEAKFEREAPNMAVNSLWFSSKKFSGEEAVQRWCEERGMDSAKIERTEGSYKISVGKTVADTERAVWASPGVVALVGIEKIDTGALAGGGSLNPLQQGTPDKADKKDEETKTETVAEKELSSLEKTFAKFEVDLIKALA